MSAPRSCVGVCLCLAFCAPPLCAAATAAATSLLVRKSAAGVSYEPVERIFLNGKEQVRIVTGDGQFAPQAQRKLALIKTATLRSIRKDPQTGVFYGTDSSGKSVILFPDSMKSSETPATAFGKATLAVLTAGQKKPGTPVAAGEFLALLAGNAADEMACSYAGQESNFNLGAPSASLALQARAMTAAVSAYGNSAACGRMKTALESSLRHAIDAFESGRGTAEGLARAIWLAELSDRTYRNEPAQIALRGQLAQRRAWLDRHLRIARALEAGSQWDAYLLKVRELERYQEAFTELKVAYRNALEKSRDEHMANAALRTNRKDFRGAYEEYQKSLKRDPAHSVARERAENARLEMLDTMPCEKPAIDLNSTVGVVVNRHIELAKVYLEESKIDDAVAEIVAAERVHTEIPGVLLMKARIQRAQGKFVEAMATLERHDRAVCSRAERAASEPVRVQLIVALRKAREGKLKTVKELVAGSRYGSAMREIQEGLQADPDNNDLLLEGGRLAPALRQRDEARKLLARFLSASDNLSGDPKARTEAQRLIETLAAAKPAPAMAAAGEPVNWMSGVAAPRDVFYDPSSLAFSVPPVEVRGSDKLHAAFNWKGPRLESVVSDSESKLAQGSHAVSFAYDPAGCVSRVFEGAKPQANPRPMQTDLHEPFQGPGAPVLLSNHPLLDLSYIERELHQQVGLIVAGNRYFHPFVWETPVVFRVSYDELGRVASARQVIEAGTGRSLAPEVATFTWEGAKLQAILVSGARADGTADPARPLYSRKLRYVNGRLAGEDISYGGYHARIEYRFNGGRLVSADCEKDHSLDGRSRQVRF
ncbi:MAG: tetratricopeptide repeat protein [Paludibaculum sp.]